MARLPSSTFDEDVAFDRSLSIDFSQRLRGLDQLVEAVAIEVEQTSRPGAVRSSPKMKGAISCLFANLLRVYLADSRGFLNVPLRTQSFTKNRYRNPPAARGIFTRIVRHLLAHELIKVKTGFSDPNSRIGRATKIRTTEALINRLRAALPEASHASASAFLYAIERTSSEIIRQRDAEGNEVDYEACSEAEQMRTRLKAWNEFAALHWIDIAVRDDELIGCSISSRDDETEEQRTERRHRTGFALPDFTANQLHRVFNRSSFRFGGRFYGGWWQSVPKAYRKRIMIDGHPTREVDFSAMLLRMLYDLNGAEMVGDPYTLEEIDPRHRPIIKKALLALINAGSDQRIQTQQTDGMPITWPELIERLQTKHRQISHYFHSGIGLELQRKDSDIAEIVMIEAAKGNVLVLPVHDSFVVPHMRTNSIKQLMMDAYRRVMGGSAQVHVDPSFVDEATEQEPCLFDGAETEEHYAALDQELSEGYSLYLARETAYRRFYGADYIERQLGSFYGPPEALRLFQNLHEPSY